MLANIEFRYNKKDNHLKRCPFCNGAVEFEMSAAVYNRLVKGQCSQCGMMFAYQEQHEHIELHKLNGDLPVVTTLKQMRALNAPFEVVWNSRIGEKERTQRGAKV